jgi:hypothetical protein
LLLPLLCREIVKNLRVLTYPISNSAPNFQN